MVEKETQTFMDVVMPVVEYEDEKRATSVQVQRPQNLKDKTIALLPNFRTVSPAFLQVLAKQLQTDTNVGRAFMHNPPDWPFNHPEHLSRIAPEVVKFARQCDLMVSGVGDWGGCTLWSCHACVEFEKNGVPGVVIVTDNFEVPAHQVLKSLGYPDIPVLVTPNPVMYLTEPEIQDRVNSLIGKVAESLCNTGQ